MTTEIIGYIGQPTQKPTEMHTEPRKTIKIHIANKTKARLLGVCMIALGALTIPMENDATAFVMCLMLGTAAMIGGNDNE